MTAIKIKRSSKSADAPPPAALKSTASISSGDDAAPASSNANGRDVNSSNVDDSSHGESFSGNEEAVVDGGDVKASVAKAGKGEEEDVTGEEEEDANHDSNDAAGEDGNVETTANGDGKKEDEEEGNDEEKEDSPPDEEDANASGKNGQEEEANDAEENLKEEDGGNEGEEEGAEEDEEEMWELKKILTVEEISTRNFMCNGVGCPNVACSVYQSTHDTNCVNAWFSCLDCQENDYGGWPEHKSEIPMTFMTKQHRETIRQYCTRNPVNAVFPDLPTSRNGEEEEKSDDEEAGEGEGKWDLIEVIAVKDLKKKKPKRCEEENCTSAACSVWASNAAPDDEWYGCIDCMQEYYEGWPSSDEMPVKYLTEEHRALLAEKCSQQENPPMPDLPTTMPLLATAGGNNVANITPLPSHEQAVAENQSNLVVGAIRTKGKKSGVTPSPMPPKGASKQAGKKGSKVDPKVKAMYDKWQGEAEKLGGTTIVVDKNEAKKVVFDKLHDLFSPVNITQLHQKLKGLVPQPILRQSLNKMVDKSNDNPFADDSDDEDEKPSKKKSASKVSTDEYAGSIRVKEGRNTNNTLYYVDHTKLQNNGNGLLPEARNELFSNLEMSKQELAVLGQKNKQICSDTKQLLSEPKNAELETELQELANKMEILDNGLEEAGAHASNAKRAKQLKGQIDKMASEWRKRKRLCNEFFQNMEEATDGTINMKKCCKGDGPIDIENDEGAIKGAKDYALKKSKRPKVVTKGMLKQRNGATTPNTGLQPDERFIGVLLDSKGMPQRVYTEDYSFPLSNTCKMDSKPPRNYNEDLVNMITDLKRKKDAVGKEIENESRLRDEIKSRIAQEQQRLSHSESRLSKLESSNEAYAKMVKEAEAAYKKIEQSSQTLLHVMKRESKVIEKDLSGEV